MKPAPGIVGVGMLAIPVLAGSSAYAISESFGFKHGLYRKLKGGVCILWCHHRLGGHRNRFELHWT